MPKGLPDLPHRALFKPAAPAKAAKAPKKVAKVKAPAPKAAKSRASEPRKRAPKGSGRGEAVLVRFNDRSLLARVDAKLNGRTRPEAIRDAVEKAYPA